MKKRTAMQLMQSILTEIHMTVKNLDLSKVENADRLLRGIEMLQQVLDNYPETSRKKLEKKLGDLHLSEFTPAEPPIDQNRIVQHLWQHATMAVRDSIDPNGKAPLLFTDSEHAVFSMLMGDDESFICERFPQATASGGSGSGVDPDTFGGDLPAPQIVGVVAGGNGG